MPKIKAATKAAIASIRIFRKQILAALLVFSIIGVVYWRDLGILLNEALHNDAASHILMVPFLVGFLIYRKKDLIIASIESKNIGKRKRIEHVDEAVGIALCTAAFLLYWAGSYTFYPLEYHLGSLPIFITGLIMVLFGFRTIQKLILPILFLLFLIPLPSEIVYTIGGTLANFNTHASYTLLTFLRLPITLETSYGPPTLAITTSSQPIYFSVDVPCSGIYSFTAFIMLATFLAYIVTAPAIKKAGIFMLGFVVFLLMNILRITGIVSIGYWFGEEIAMLFFHTVTGWLLIFAGMLLVLFTAEKLLKITISQSQEGLPPCPNCSKSLRKFENFCANCGKFLGSFQSKISTMFWAKLLILLLGSYLVTLSIQAPTFAVASGTLEITSDSNMGNATTVFPEIPEYQLNFLYRDENYEKIAGQDASLIYAYIPTNLSKTTVYVDIGVANTISNLHNWEVCLVTWQIAQGSNPIVNVLDSRDIQLLEDVPIIARYLVFETSTEYTQVTLYWYEKANFKIGLTVSQKYVRISLIILTRNSTKYPQFENELFNFGQSIASYWKPLESQSLVSIGIPMQQGLLGLSIGFAVISKSAEYTQRWRRKKNTLRIFNNFASPTEKLILESVRQITKESKGTQISHLASTIASKTGKHIEIDEINAILLQLEEHGLVEKRTINIKGKPVLIWTS